MTDDKSDKLFRPAISGKTKDSVPLEKIEVESEPSKEAIVSDYQQPTEDLQIFGHVDPSTSYDIIEFIKKEIKAQLEQHIEESSKMLEEIPILKLEIERLNKILNLIKPLIVDYRKIDMPASFFNFVEQCKATFPDLKLFLKKRKENILVCVNFSQEFTVENEVKFYEMFSDMEIVNIEYKFETMIVRGELTDDYEKLI